MKAFVTALATGLLLVAGPVHAERTTVSDNRESVAVAVVWSGLFAALLYEAHEDRPESD